MLIQKDPPNFDYPDFFIILKNLMLKSRFGDYSDTYTLVKETITVPNTAAAGAALDKIHKK